jgi:hypothetical protein
MIVVHIGLSSSLPSYVVYNKYFSVLVNYKCLYVVLDIVVCENAGSSVGAWRED